MALLLNIETSSPVCSVCLSRDGVVLAIREDFSPTNHASVLTIFIQQLFEETSLSLNDLDAVAVSSGPGSYTGLRIGSVTAKGLCYTLNKPLIAIDSLQALASGLEVKYSDNYFIYCPTVDARRDEIYFGLFGKNGEVIISSTNSILQNMPPFRIDESKQVLVAGSGVEKCRKFWKGTCVYDEIHGVTSRDLIRLAEKKNSSGQFEEITSFEPRYIKPVHITSLRS